MSSLLLQYGQAWWYGLMTTLSITCLALFFGFLLGIGLALASLSRRFYLRWPSALFIYLIQGTPFLVQLFLIYYGLGQFGWLKKTWLWHGLKQPFTCAVLALTFNTGAYASVLFREAILTIPKGEIMACEALGFSSWQMLRYILFPRTVKLMLPVYINEIIILIKLSSLVSTITILDLMGVTQQIMGITYQPWRCLFIVSIIYLLLNGLISLLGRWLENKWRIVC